MTIFCMTRSVSSLEMFIIDPDALWAFLRFQGRLDDSLQYLFSNSRDQARKPTLRHAPVEGCGLKGQMG